MIHNYRSEKKKIALVRLGLSFIFVTLCILLPLLRLTHFFEWRLLDIHTDFIRVYEHTAKCYFDGYSLFTTDRYSSEVVFMRYTGSVHLFQINVDWTIISMAGRGMIFLGLFILYVNVISLIKTWRINTQDESRLVVWSSMLGIMAISAYWILLVLSFSRISPLEGILSRDIQIIKPPTPNLILVVLTMIGIASLIISIKIESIMRLFKSLQTKELY